MHRPNRLAAVALVAGSLALAGCSGSGSSTVTVTAGGATSAAASGGGNTGGGAANTPAGQAQQVDNGAAAAGIDVNNPPPAIGTVVMPSTKKGIKDAKVELVQMRVKDKALIGVFRITANGTTSDKVSVYTLFSGDCPQLVDLVNLKQYRCVSELSSSMHEDAPIGTPLYYFTGWPLPQGTDVVNVKLSTGPMIENVKFR